MQIQPYLFFDGRCEEALDYYRTTLGAEVMAVMYYKDHPDQNDAEACLPANWTATSVMHASFRIGETIVFASDGMCGGQSNFEGFSLSLTTDDKAQAGRLFSALAETGNVVMPLEETFFSPAFGMVQDRFGVSWMIYVEGKE